MRQRKRVSKKSPTACQPSANAYARVYVGHVVLPVDRLWVLNEATPVDYEYGDGKRNWKLKDAKGFEMALISEDELTAMKVAQQLGV